MAKIRKRVLIAGVVQGVAFRYYTRSVARKAGVCGWVRNLPDGRVEAVFEGEQPDVQTVVNWCELGPPGGRVDSVQAFTEPYRGEFADFDIAFF
ncbi:MAG: acylphosphatase [Thermodesulfobacteriota bacterium]